jgi:hypothetical protein
VAVPTITNVSPNTGPTGGFQFVVIAGTNFNTSPAQPLTGPTSPLSDPVLVKINGDQVIKIFSASNSEVWVLTPPFHGTPTDDPIAAVTVSLTNLDIDGNPIVGETVTVTSAYTYRRPILHSTAGNITARPHPFSLVSAGLITAFRRQVFLNVMQTTHIDYAEPGVLMLNIAKIPSLVIQGPNITKDLEYTHNELIYEDIDDTHTAIKQPPDVVRMGYTFLCISDSEQELLNIMGSFQLFFAKNKYLSVPIDPFDVNSERANLVMQLTQFPQATTTPSDSNIRVWVATADIRGVEIHLDEYADKTTDIAQVELEMQKLIEEVIIL